MPVDIAELGRPHRFTAERARELALRRHHPPAPPVPLDAASPQNTPAANLALEGYQAEQLARVKEHVERLHGMMAEATEPMDIDRLARALNTLLDRARILSGIAPLKPAPVPRVKPSSNLPDPT